MPLERPTKEELRNILRANIGETISRVNEALFGEELEFLEPVLARVGRGGRLPHWYAQLKNNHTLPNLDGKTIGSVVEMILLAVLETFTFEEIEIPRLRINPARGVDLPDLDLGVKSPSTNFCTSEPFFSAYERLYGSEYDVIVMITDYQEAKKKPPLKLQIIHGRYLNRTQIADKELCRIAIKHREWLLAENEAWAKKVFRFLAYVNQRDWRARHLLRLVDHLQDEAMIKSLIIKARKDFDKKNEKRESKDEDPIPETDLQALSNILDVQPLLLGVIDAAGNWVIEFLKDVARAPNENEWNRLLKSPLDGRIGMSYALQWRYDFRKLFNGEDERDQEDACEET